MLVEKNFLSFLLAIIKYICLCFKLLINGANHKIVLLILNGVVLIVRFLNLLLVV